MIFVLIPLFFFALTAISAVMEPRKIRIGVYFLTGILVTSIMVLIVSFSYLNSTYENTDIVSFGLLGLIALVALSVVSLGVLLVLNGLKVLRKEGRALSHTLSLFLGVLVLTYVFLAFYALYVNNMNLFSYLFLLAFPLGWLGYGLIAFLLWSQVYAFVATRARHSIEAVVVLGAGLIDGYRIGPLLRGRVDLGIEWALKHQAKNDGILLVMSGGQGSDEQLSEAEAMARYAHEKGVGSLTVLEEKESRTTQENLILSMRLVNSRIPVKHLAVATSSFHAFRAALLMRKLQIPGYAIGSSTARYYWPTAVLREYVAILRDNLWINVVGLGISLLPFAIVVLERVNGVA